MQVLHRDNYCCVFTGAADLISLGEVMPEDSDERMVMANVAHIISQSLSDGIVGPSEAIQAKVTMSTSRHIVSVS